MEKNQEIKCSVTSCKYNNSEYGKCSLKTIQVDPTIECNTKQPDESMCSSYEYFKG